VKYFCFQKHSKLPVALQILTPMALSLAAVGSTPDHGDIFFFLKATTQCIPRWDSIPCPLDPLAEMIPLDHVARVFCHFLLGISGANPTINKPSDAKI
jgi:hypothetical protein